MPPISPRSIPWILTSVTLGASVSAQALLYSSPGYSSAGGEDYDQDGYDDWVASGVAYSGQTGAVLYDFNPQIPGGLAWRLEAIGDVDGDGVGDLACLGQVHDGPIHFVSGRTGVLIGSAQPLACIYRLKSVAGGGDADGDGAADAVYTAFDDFFPTDGMVGFASGGTLTAGSIFGACGLQYGNFRADLVDDLTGDGLDDIVYADFFQTVIVSMAGGVPQTIRTIPFFAFVDSVADRTGDGFPELLGTSSTGDVIIRSGADDSVLLQKSVPGLLSGSPGDFDCDGIEDFLMRDVTTICVWSGDDGTLLWQEPWTLGSGPFDLTRGGDVDADGVPDFVISGVTTQVWSTAGPAVSTYCTGKATSAGCTPNVDWFGQPTGTGPDDFLITTRNSLANRPGLFFFGTSGRLAVPFLGGTLCVAPSLTRGPVILSQGPADCSAGYAFLFGQSFAQAHGLGGGDTVNGQFWMRDPNQADGTGVALSDAIEFAWCE